MRLRTIAIVTFTVFAIAVAGALTWRHGLSARDSVGASGPRPGRARVAVPDDQRAPDSVRIRVQVLNATRTRGLARRAMFVLRDRGFDVVDMGTAGEQRDSTLVIDVAGQPEWAARVANVFGGARVESRPDTSRYLDVTVLIGASWRPPAEPFYP
ncbi:MAG: LytR C-terminal domain-containing protein [Gemmatimonadaceae bacterium]|nr:LytR C-terminal domain-containing protein [Gemmatimonadaceae bacterium]